MPLCREVGVKSGSREVVQYALTKKERLQSHFQCLRAREKVSRSSDEGKERSQLTGLLSVITLDTSRGGVHSVVGGRAFLDAGVRGVEEEGDARLGAAAIE